MPQQIIHTFEPIYDHSSKILILGTMPSPKSRENGFYYGHPQNRFWRVLAEVLDEPVPQCNEERIALLRVHHIALWDVLHACTIEGASDSSIKNPVPNDIPIILHAAPIGAIFTTGQKATELYNRYCLAAAGISPVYLPSTSPANIGRFPYEALVSAYRCILPFLKP